MRMHRRNTISRTAIAGLVGLAVIATALLATGGTVQAQVKHWSKIKYPELREFKPPEPEQYTMSNGITVLLIEDHELPLIEMDVRVRTGSRLEPAEMAGLADVLGGVMRTGGAGSRSGDEIDEFLEGLGAVIETGMQTTVGWAELSCLKENFPEVARALSDILRSPKFEQKKIDVAKNQEKAAIARRNDDPWGIMFREGQRLVYGKDSPYSRMIEYATLDAFDRNDLKAFHAKYFIPNRTYIGVVGDFDSAAMKRTLEEVFGDWRRGPEFEDPEIPVEMAAKPAVYHVLKEDMTQSNIYMGHLGIQRNDDDYYTSRMLNQVLSGSGFSRLFNNIRTEKGLAYRVTGSLGANYDYPGTFSLFMSTKTETTAASIDALLEEVDALLAAPPTEEEMQRARDGLLNSFIFNFDTKGEVLAQQLTLAYYDYPSDFIVRFKDRINEVTAEDIHQLARKRINKDQLAILVVGKNEGLDRPLASFGEVTQLDVTIPEPAAAVTAIAAAPGLSMEQAVARGSQVLDKVVGAVGGAARVDAVKSVKMEIGVGVVTPSGEFQVSATRILALPDRMRMEMNTPMGRAVEVVTPTEAFAETPRGIQPLPADRKADGLKAMRRELIALLQARQDPDTKAIFTGKETVEGVECDMIAVMLGEDNNVRFAVDPSSGRVMMAAHQGKNMQGVPGEITSYFSDYREVDGISMPFKVRQMFNGEPMATFDVKEIVINGEIDEAGFQMPEVAAEGAPSGGR